MSTYFQRRWSGSKSKMVRRDAAGKTVGHSRKQRFFPENAIRNGPRFWTWAITWSSLTRKARFTGSVDAKSLSPPHFYPGGLRETTVTEMFAKHPERVIEPAVARYAPKRNWDGQWPRRKVYADAEHPHAAQQPATLDFLPAISNIKRI